jgi:hypothetical protein
MVYKNITNLILSTLFLLCLFNWNYGYYQLVRFLGMIGFIYLTYQERNSKTIWFYLWLCSAILINPFFKIALDRAIWNIVDIIWALLLIGDIFLSKSKDKE